MSTGFIHILAYDRISFKKLNNIPLYANTHFKTYIIILLLGVKHSD